MMSENSSVKVIDLIENHIEKIKIGTITLKTKSRIITKVIPFVYHEKNIFFFINNEDEDLESMEENIDAWFAGCHDINGLSEGIKYIEIYISGTIKNLRSESLTEKVVDKFYLKYFGQIKKPTIWENVTLFMIDTTNIKAAEVTGGIH